MSTLWTPGGEVPVNRTPADDAAADNDGAAGADAGSIGAADLAGLDLDDLSPEEREAAEEYVREMAAARERLIEAPAADVVANHAMGIYELAALHLTHQPPNFSKASVAIDALAALLDGMKGRLGPSEPTLREALDQARMAFVRLKNRPTAMSSADAESAD